MESQSQIYYIDGVKMKFNKMAYRKFLESFCKEQRRKKQAVEDEIAKRTGLTPNVPHKWCYGESTPSKLEYVKVAAATLAISDFRSLLTTIEEGKEVEKLSDRQVTAVKRIYDECIWFLSEFNKTDGLNSFWQMYSDQELEDPEALINEMADSLHVRKKAGSGMFAPPGHLS